MSTETTTGTTVLVGGVGELYQGDLDLGRRVVEDLSAEGLGAHVAIEDLHYGAVAVAQRLEDLRPATLILVGAAVRGRAPATVERRRIQTEPVPVEPAAFQVAMGDAITGYVTIDLVVEVAHGLGALPSRTVAIEVEPVETSSGEQLSTEVAATVGAVGELVRAETRRAPLLELADRLRSMLSGDRLAPSPARTAMRDLLGELEHLDAEGRWGGAFTCRDRLRRFLAEGEASDRMDHLDWGLWWALIEELDRLQPLEFAS